jgi:hypothetical protein
VGFNAQTPFWHDICSYLFYDVEKIPTHMYFTCIHIFYMHTYIYFTRIPTNIVHAYLHILYMPTYIYFTCIHIFTYVHTYMHTYIYICTYIHAYIYAYIHKFLLAYESSRGQLNSLSDKPFSLSNRKKHAQENGILCTYIRTYIET